MGDVKEFHVKTKAVDRCAFNNRPADTHPKSLKAALSVPEGKTRRQAHYKIENAATLLSSPGLMHANQASIQGPRPECQITLAAQDWLDQFGGFGNRRRKVGIGK